LVRTREWQLEAVRQEDDQAIVVEWSIRENEGMLEEWPHKFRLRYRLTVGRSLSMLLEVENTSAEAFVFEEALHTYLRVSDARTVSVRGFGGKEYLDKVDGLTRKTEAESSLRLNGETDRIYLNTPSTCYIDDLDYSRTLEIAKTGSATTVLWNPWIAKAAALADFGDDEWPEMICIETANAAQNALPLQPGERHEMSASVRVLPFAH
jgi:glucose-6-phosphate 1-epimerase